MENGKGVESGGAMYNGAKCYTLIYGGCTFDSNTTPGNGGAVSLGRVDDLGRRRVDEGVIVALEAYPEFFLDCHGIPCSSVV